MIILIIKSDKHEVKIENPSFIPAMYSKITTKEFKVARVVDVHHDFTSTQHVVTVIVEVFSDTT